MSEHIEKDVEQVTQGEYIAYVDVELIYRDGDSWGPYYSPTEIKKLDEVRLALRRGDIETASRYGKVFRLVPV